MPQVFLFPTIPLMVGRVGMLLSVWCAGPIVVMFQNAALLWLYESDWFKAAGL